MRTSDILLNLLTVVVVGAPAALTLISIKNALKRYPRAVQQLELAYRAHEISKSWLPEGRSYSIDPLYEAERFFTLLQAFKGDSYYRFAGRVLIAHVGNRMYDYFSQKQERFLSQQKISEELSDLYRALRQKNRLHLYLCMSRLLHVVLKEEAKAANISITSQMKQAETQLFADLEEVVESLQNDDEFRAFKILMPWMNIPKLLSLPLEFPVTLFYLRDRLLAAGVNPNAHIFIDASKRANVPQEQAAFFKQAIEKLHTRNFPQLLTLMVKDQEVLSSAE